MSGKDTMMEIDKMSNQEKAAMLDRLSDADKNAATKMAGHDMSKLSAQDLMAITDELSVDHKAMSYSKLAMSKHIDKRTKWPWTRRPRGSPKTGQS
jgi:hypothetical protein